MVKLGMKMTRAFTRLGGKTTQAFNKIGVKSNSVMNKTKNIAGRLENTAINTLDKARSDINKIPDINEKGIKLSIK